MSLTIAIIAHDEKKKALADWVIRHEADLLGHQLIGTASTGALVHKFSPELSIDLVKSGPLGGDQQIGAMIAEGKIDLLIFFPDPLTSMPHDVDVKALLRLALVYDTPCAFNSSSADQIVASGMLKPEGEASGVAPTTRAAAAAAP
jgi:methylglyoxal synthase